MIEIWRKDAVYTFDFWPGAEVKPLAETRFRVDGADITVSYAWPKDHGYAPAREVVTTVEERCLRIDGERTPVVSSGVKPFEGGVGEAWRCELDLLRGELAAEAIAREYSDGLVVSFERKPEDRAAVLATVGKLEALALRTGRAEGGGLLPEEGELSYRLGPVLILAPELWTLTPRVNASLRGDRFKFHEIEFEFSERSDPRADWFETPPEVQAYVIEDDMLVSTDPVEQAFPEGTARSICWGAVPPIPGPGEELLSDDVCTTVVTVIEWSSGSSCRILATQWIGTHDFDRERDLVGLRDLIMGVATSGRRSLRNAD